MTASYKGNGMRVNQNGSWESKGRLFEAIRQVSFVLDELRLFLDTHSDNREALAMFKENQERRTELINKYTDKYGPIDSYQINNDGTWSWVNSPMPWKAEAN